MKKRFATSAFVLGLVLSPAAAWAQQPAAAPAGKPAEAEGAIDELDLLKLLNVEVSTATKTSENLDDAPAVITVVTHDDIVRWGYRDVADVLNHTVGFFSIDDHILPNVGVRGMTGGLGAESGVIKVMIDGRSVAYRTTSGNWLGVELIPMESIAQIEIIRGPASALYGADAFLGVVNIITRKPDDQRPLRARAALGQEAGHPQARLDVVSGSKIGKFDFMFGAAGEYANRSGVALPPESPAPTLPPWVGTRRIANDLDRRSIVLQGRGGYEDARGRVSVSVYASAIQRGGDFAHWAQLSGGTDLTGHSVGTNVALGQLRVNADGVIHATPKLDIAIAATYSRGGVLPPDRVEVGSDLFYVLRKQAYNGADGLVEARWIPTGRFNLVGGVEASYDHEDLAAPTRIDRLTGMPVLVGTAEGSTASLANVGAYLSSNLKILDPYLKLTGGVRFDGNSQYGSQVTGRAGITSRLSKSFVVKLLYGSAFKAPSPYLLYATPLRPGDVVGNPNLKPQHIHTGELQLSWKPAPIFGITSSVSYNWLLDKAEFTPQGLNLIAQNVASQKSLSWETRADVRHRDDVNIYGSFALVSSVRDLGQEGYAANLIGTQNVVYPSWIARAGMMFGVPSLPSVPLQIGAEGMVVGPRRAADTSIVENGASFDLPPYFVLDFTLATRELYLVRGHESRIALRAKNILAARGPNPGFSGFEYPLEPAQMFLEFHHTY